MRRSPRLVAARRPRKPGAGAGAARREGLNGVRPRCRAASKAVASRAGATPVPAATPSRAEAAAERSSSDRASRSTRGPGAHATRAPHWNSEPARVRRWLIPTTLAPPTTTSPGPSAGEAHQPRPRRRRTGTAFVHRRPLHAHVGQRPRPRPPDPGEGPAHVGLGQNVPRGQEHVDPHRLPRPEQHRPPTSPPADHVDPGRRGPPPVDDRLGLRAPQHQRGPVDLDEPRRPHRGHGPRPVEKRGRRPPLVVDGETAPSARDQADRAAPACR